MQNSSWQNYAFISYRHTDVRQARWLQRKLESYRLPAALQKKTEASARIRPVFRDNTDLSSGLLRDELRRELERSRYLIVICSRELAQQSEYVDFEIRCFLDGGREQNIIPFIIDGTPNAKDPADECFPPALRGMADPPLGIDLQKDSRRKALIRLVSALLGVRFDTLWQRDVRRLRAQRTVLAVATAAVLAVGALAYDYYVPKSRHYADYALRYGVPVGIGELSAEQLRQSGGFYTLVSSRGQVRELRHENAQGVLLEDDSAVVPDRPVWVKFETYSGDALRVARYFNQSGAPILTLKYSELFGADGRTQTIDFYQGYNDSIAQNMVADLAGATANLIRDLVTGTRRSRIIRNIVTYTAEGFACRVLYASDTRSLKHYAADANGIYGQDFEVNALGQRTRIYNLNARGERAVLPNGVACEQIEYDGFLPGRLSYLNQTGGLILGEDGYAVQTYEHDPAYNVTAYADYDAQGTLTLCRKGYARAEFTFRNGELVRQQVLDASLRPCYAFGYSACVFKYENGLRVSTRALDAEGNPCRDEDGYAEYRIACDERNRLVREECRDENGNLCFNAQGYAVALYAYDAQSNLIRTAYLGPDGNPCYNSDGICVQQDDYQDSVLCAVRYLDGNGRPVINPKVGFATMLVEYEDDNRTRETYLDAEGNPCCCKDGYAEARFTYEDGNQTGAAYFGTDGKPCCVQNVASVKAEYRQGLITRWVNLDATGLPTIDREGCAEYKYQYDDLGRMVESTCYDNNGGLTLCAAGYACKRYAYDDRNRLIRESYFDRMLNPVCSGDGYAAVTYRYDDYGNITQVDSLNTIYELTMVNGYTTERRAYDTRGNVTERSYFVRNDTQKYPVNNAEGYSVQRSTYNALDQETSRVYEDKDGRPGTDANGVYRYHFEYDRNGKITAVQRFQTDGSPTPNASLYRTQYDEKGQLVDEQWLQNDTMIRQTTYRYDDRGQRTDTLYWLAGGKPSMENGYHWLRQTYDPFGQVIKTEYLDAAGRPAEARDGCAMVSTQYDSFGRLTAEEYRDSKGNLCENADGYARVEYDFNPQGFWSEMRTYDAAGMPQSPVSITQWQYNSAGYKT